MLIKDINSSDHLISSIPVTGATVQGVSVQVERMQETSPLPETSLIIIFEL